MKNTYIITGLGGCFGVMLRVFLAKIFPVSLMGLPSYILLVNVLGCFLLGVVLEILTLYADLGLQWRYFWITGFLGGLTTFSSYIFEFDFLLTKHHYIMGLVYLCLSPILGFLMYLLAIYLVRWLYI